jgi:transposase-like protein
MVMDEMQRWEILRLHIEDGITLTDLARSTGISTRTLSRWSARYRADCGETGGIDGAVERQGVE